MHEPPENMQDEPEKEWNDAEVNAEVNRARQIERDQMAEYFDREAGRSFAVPVELAAQYKYEPYSPPPEDILGSRQFDEDLRLMLEGDGSMQNVIDPSAPPAQLFTLEKIIEATKYVQRRARVASLGYYGPRNVMAIAASLAAEFPGMFAGPDILGPVRMPLPPLDVERYRPKPPPIVIDADPPPLEKRPGHRKGYRVGLTTKGGGKPPGSKLARKAAKGKL